jgi:hypothetical protein
MTYVIERQMKPNVEKDSPPNPRDSSVAPLLLNDMVDDVKSAGITL